MEKILSIITVPGFLLLVLAEYLIAKRKKKKYFTYESTVSNLSIGTIERIFSVILALFFIGIYNYIYVHFAIFTIPENVYTWVLILFVTDFLWYWYHRLSHEVNILWSAHVVHHSSGEYNLTVAARITIIQNFVRILFWSILPLIGFPTHMLVAAISLLGIYQIFLHTRLVSKLGFLEHFLVTPSHHRVHHGSNPQYLDKNYGGMFIIWDKLFHTFKEEKETVVYGLTKPLKSTSFLWAHFHSMVEIIFNVYYTKGIRNKFQLLFGKPSEVQTNEVLNKQLEDFFVGESAPDKENKVTRSFLKSYINAQLFSIIGAPVIFRFSGLDINTKILFGLIILTTLINCGALLEKKGWIIYLEYARLLLIVFALSFYFNSSILLTVGMSIFIIGIYFFSETKKIVLKNIYGNISN